MRLFAIFLLGLFFLPLHLCAQLNGVGQHPALGWGSWTQQLLNGQGWADEAHIKAQSDALKASGLQKHGYVFINIDSGWQSGFDQYGRPMVNTTLYPDGLAGVAQYIHNNGQKAGIYWIPGIQYPAYTANGTIYGTSYAIDSIVELGVPGNAFSYTQACCSYWHMKIDFTKPGAQEYVNSVVKLFASWGFDAIKLDGVTPGSDINNLTIDNRAEVQAWAAAVAASGRPMELTVSWALDHDYLSTWQNYANARRIEDDVNCYCSTATQWNDITRLFVDLEKWQHDAGPTLGWNDLDSLLVGNGLTDGLTQDERQSAMTLWAISNSPMIIGDDLTQVDAFGMSLLGNDDVIGVNQSGAPATEVTGGNNPVWASPALSNGTSNVALFNLNNSASTTAVSLSNLGITGSVDVYDLWAGKDLGAFTGTFSAILNPHASALVRMTPITSTQIPGAPGSVAAEPGNGQVKLTWNASSGATSYTVYRAASAGAETRLSGGITGTSYTDATAVNGTTYFYKVTAVNSAGESAQSNEVSSTPTAGFQVSTSTTSLSITGSGQATSTITISPNYDTRTLTFACSNAPAGYSCTLTPSSLALAGVTTAQTVTLKVSNQTATLGGQPGLPRRTHVLLSFALLMPGVLLWAFAPEKLRRQKRTLVAMVVLGAGVALTACGSSSGPAAPQSRVYSFQVTMQSGGATVQTLSYTLTVQ